MSARGLRGLAYAVFALCVACYVASIVFEYLNPAGYTSWGTGSALPLISFVVATTAFAVVGVLILRRDPRNTIGWLMLAIGAVWAWSGAAEGYVLYSLTTRPGALPAPELVAATSSFLWIPAIGLMGVFLVLLFPDGHLPSRRWRPVAWVGAVAIVIASLTETFRPGPIDDTSVKGISNPLGVAPMATFFDVMELSLFVLPLGIVLSATALIVRFRRSHGVERLQIKWLASAGAFVALVYTVGVIATLTLAPSGPAPYWILLLQDAGLASFIVIPVAIGFAILKHRLYGIDVVINKSVVFGTLAAFITVVYVGIVVGVGHLAGGGDRPNLALSIAATAVVAVAFQPVRERVQRFANRIVYGDRATPYEVLSDFADRMGGSYDATDLLPMMARTVGEGVGANRVGIWLAGGAGLSLDVTWPDETGPGHTTATDLEQLGGDRVVPVRHQGELLGALTVDKPAGEMLTPSEARLLDDVAAQAGLVLRNVRLIDDLRGSRLRLVRTQDAERRRLERNLHDGAQQSLVAVALIVRMIRSRLDGDSLAVGRTLDQAADELGRAIDELRALARGIYPAILSERGIGPAVSSLAERSAVPVVVEDASGERPPAEVEATMYHVVAEALANAAQHAHATQAQVRLGRAGDTLTLEVVDDGVGGADAARGAGLRNVADRVSVVDGTLEITSPPGEGTRIRCTFPVAAPHRRTDVAPDRQKNPLPLGAGL